jgi:hypothetical protein
LTPEIKIPDSYLVFLMLVQIFSYVVVVEVGVWKTGGASPGCGLEVWTNCGQGRVTAALTTTGPELDGLRCHDHPWSNTSTERKEKKKKKKTSSQLIELTQVNN